MTKFSKFLIACGAVSIVGGAEGEEAAALLGGLGGMEIAGIMALLISLGLVAGGNSQSN